MYPYLRLLGVLLSNRVRRRPFRILDEATLRFHVWPSDLDMFGHMNNGRFLTLMDLGRLDVLDKLGALRLWRRRHWIAVVGTATMRFLRPLDPFEGYELRTRIRGWDEKWFYIEQCFQQDGKRFAEGTIQGLIRGPGASIPTREVLEALGVEEASPPLERAGS